MRLSSNDKRILDRVYLDAETPLTEIAKELGLKEHTVRYSIDKMESRGLLQRSAFIDVYSLGLLHYGLFFSLSTGKKGRYNEVLNFLANSEKVSFVVELGGEFNLGASLCVKNIIELAELQNTLSTRFGDIIHEKQIAARLRLIDFSPKFLLGRESKKESLSWGATDAQNTIDRLDHEILSAITRTPAATLRELAHALGASSATIDLRLKKLRRNGIFKRMRYLVDFEKLGALSFVILVYVRSLDKALRERMLRFCAQHPNVAFVVENMGSWDFELGIHTFHARTVVDITSDLYDLLGAGVSTIKALPVFAFSKVSNYPFLKMP